VGDPIDLQDPDRVQLVGPELVGWLVDKLRRSSEPVGLDTETVGVDPKLESPVGRGQVVCWSLSTLTEKPHPRLPGVRLGTRLFLWGEALEAFKSWFESTEHPKVGHNLFGFDTHVLANHGIRLSGILGDTLRLSKFLDPVKSVQHDLKSRMKWTLGYPGVGEFKEIFRRPAILRRSRVIKRDRYSVELDRPTLLIAGEYPKISFKSFTPIPLDTIREQHPGLLERLYDYATLDAKATLELYQYFAGRLRGDTYRRVWHPGSLVLSEAERSGVYVEARRLSPGRVHALRDEKQHLAKLQKWRPDVTNWNSGPQLERLLYEELGYGIPRIAGTKKAVKINWKGKRVKDEAAILWHLENSACNPDERAGLEALLEYRKANKFGQFLQGLPSYTDDAGRIHPAMGPDTDTGRVACRRPNLQQIPSNDPYQIRAAFRASRGSVLVVADYSQLEMVVLAHFVKEMFSDDKLASDLIASDAHSATAKRCWPDQLRTISVDDIKHHPDPVVRALRAAAKTVNFAVNYGKGVAGLGYQIQDADGHPIGKEAAQRILDAYFGAYPGVLRYHDWVRGYAKRTGKVRTLFGRERPLPGAIAGKPSALRQALNTPIQGSAADIVMAAMLKTNTSDHPDLLAAGHFNFPLAETGARLLLQVHDELIFEVPDDKGEIARPLIVEAMEDPMRKRLTVPLRVDAKVVTNWAAAK